jgi:hypothetical protein
VAVDEDDQWISASDSRSSFKVGSGRCKCK